MSCISRYVLNDLIKVFLIALAGMTVLMLIAGLAQEAMRQGLGPATVIRLIPYAVPNALRFAVPATILFAACSVYGRIAAANELTALKSLGVPPLKVLWPGLALAFVASLFTVWLNDLAVSWGRLGVQRVVVCSIEEIAYGMLRTQRTYHNHDFSISVKRVEDRKLIRPTIAFHSAQSAGPVLLTAEEAELVLHADRGLLSLFLTNGEINVAGMASMRFPDTIEREIPLSAMADQHESTANPSIMPMHMLTQEIARQRQVIAGLKFSAASNSASSEKTDEKLSTAERQHALAHAEFRLHRLQTEPWRRWATGFSCLFFLMVGAPLALRTRSGDLWSTFGVCFLPILIVYYPLLAYGVDQAKSGALPPCSVWLGNLILGLISLPLLRKVARY